MYILYSFVIIDIILFPCRENTTEVIVKEMNCIKLCLACDDMYSQYAGVFIASVLSNAKPDSDIKIYVLDGGISESQKQKILSLTSIKDCNIDFIKINPDDFNEYKEVCTHKYITIASFYRLKLASLLPNEDKIIYFDCDMVANSDLQELFDTNLDNNLFAGVQDISKKKVKKNPYYVNAGMLIFNLKLIRKEHIEEKFLKYVSENFDNIKCGDQTIINEVCKDRIKLLNPTWNVQSSNFQNCSSYIQNPKIIHFVGKNKPWSGKSFSYHKNLYFKYLQLTPWKLEKKELDKFLRSTAIAYFKCRPLFFLNLYFYVSLFKTYIRKEY